ncbi:uncharacterized protein P884DRAFT_27910 [Thermothelomyces heterothallicus CBS 202.75]|uniref:uncharacterized protein n=1 Tax=Thermothelomyces heterothallicus CBS 202.75 TaxID=1149848 RepID=UPI0037447668
MVVFSPLGHLQRFGGLRLRLTQPAPLCAKHSRVPTASTLRRQRKEEEEEKGNTPTSDEKADPGKAS